MVYPFYSANICMLVMLPGQLALIGCCGVLIGSSRISMIVEIGDLNIMSVNQLSSASITQNSRQIGNAPKVLFATMIHIKCCSVLHNTPNIFPL